VPSDWVLLRIDEHFFHCLKRMIDRCFITRDELLFEIEVPVAGNSEFRWELKDPGFKSTIDNNWRRTMKTRKITKFMSVVVFGFGLGGCAISVSGGATLSEDGTGAIIQHQDQLMVAAAQPELPPPPEPEPAPAPPPKAKLVGQKIEITEKVMFDADQASIKEESHDLLKQVAAILKEFPSIKKIRVEGHTDSDGKARYNKKLSNKRAGAVSQFLIDTGVEKERIDFVGFGEEKPLDASETEEAKEKNRRVEFNIIEGSATKMVEVKEGA
jgi:outer membrane protein OmpA-like peptidoglycan-associated protein